MSSLEALGFVGEVPDIVREEAPHDVAHARALAREAEEFAFFQRFFNFVDYLFRLQRLA